MTREEYMLAVRSVLDQHIDFAASRLRTALSRIPAKAQRVSVDIFVDQDGEGLLDVRVGLDGPDRFVLIKALGGHALIFQSRMTRYGLAPPLPHMDPENASFSVHDALTDCAAAWVLSVWDQADRPIFRLPVTVESPEGYGTVLPIELPSQPALQ
jgi:hypothetical protein